MAHDFAKSRNRRPLEQQTKEAPSASKGMLITGIITGLAIGFSCSFVLYYSGVLPPIGIEANTQAVANEAALEEAQQRRTAELEQAAARLQLEFYKELPNYEVIVDNMPTSNSAAVERTASTNVASGTNTDTANPETANTESRPSPTPSAPVASPQGSFMLQAGAFQQEGAAVAQSMRLQALGLPARVKKEALLGKTLFLVQTGPYSTREQISQAERLLRGNNIDSMRIGISQ
ncbi:MAG: SPOR domain-containing protein [Pseudohongiellaceae bacterium]|nr:SPOR domain-containing protein [Pseudohongiellaceae bacterium]